MLTPDEMNQVKQLIAQDGNASRFRISPSNRHIHNNVDAPFVYLPYQIYAGVFPYDIGSSGLLESILPKGWTIETFGAGEYAINHNLGNANYAFVATASQSTNQKAYPVIDCFQNQVAIAWFNASGTAVDTSFNFILVALQSNSGSFPTYQTQNIPQV